jgi:L-serine deaminase
MLANLILIPSALAVKAITAAQLSMASDGVCSVTLDEAIEAMRLTAADMSVKYKETSLSVRFVFPE